MKFGLIDKDIQSGISNCLKDLRTASAAKELNSRKAPKKCNLKFYIMMRKNLFSEFPYSQK